MARKDLHLLFIRNVSASWADRDKEILQSDFIVKDLRVNIRSLMNPSWILSIYKADIIFLWFASFTYIPMVALAILLRKPYVVVSGGFDAAYAPVVKYGAFTRGRCSTLLRRLIFKMSRRVFCVSEFNMFETMSNAGVPYSKCSLVPHGFNPRPPSITLRKWEDRKNRVVMLAHCSQQTYRLKGFDLFINLAKDLPSHEFVIAGKVSPDIKDYLVLIKPGNLRIEGPLEFMGEDFVDLLNSSKFVMLPSYHESFGCAIVDAAILGCFPLVTSQSALNEVVDKIGRKLPYHDISGFRDAIVELTAMNIDVEEISESYAKRFPINSRKNALVEGIRKVLGHRVE